MKESEKDKMTSVSNLSEVKSVIMLVGGTDPTGGAGLAADISVARMLQSYPMPVVSCVTSQNSAGFRKMQPVDIDIFRDQIESTLTDIVPDAVKIGMLPSARHARVLAELLALYEHGPVIFDPVMAPTSGENNFEGNWWSDPSTLNFLMSQVDLITPNSVELNRLTEQVKEITEFLENFDINDLGDLTGEQDYDLLNNITKMHFLRMHFGLEKILLTGGHNKGEHQFCDFLLEPQTEIILNDFNSGKNQDDDDIEENGEDENESIRRYSIVRFGGKKVDTPNTHGTGCVYSTAIACLMAKGVPTAVAVGMAKEILGFLLRSGKDWRLYEDGGYGPAFSIISLPETAGDLEVTFKPGITDFLN